MPDDVRGWGPSDRFTPDMYEDYADLPRWALDSPDFDSKLEWEKHWTSTVIQWVAAAKKHQSKWKSKCQEAVMRVEEMEDSSNRTYSWEKGLAFKYIKLARAHIAEMTAMLCLNPPQGQIVATQEAQGSYAAASNSLIDAEFKANSFNQIFDGLVYEACFYNLSWLKTSVDYTRYGPYGQKGKILLERIDADDMYVDPRAKRLSWDCAGYIIQESEHEIGDIREDYPIAGFELSDRQDSSMYSTIMDDRSQDTITSPIPKLAKSASAKRQRIKVYECWFKDTRLKFVPELEDKKGYDEYGQDEINVQVPKVDDDGYVVGDWVPMYPNGRCIVISEGIVLEDMPNRLPHGSCPFIPVIMEPSKSLFMLGVATSIIEISDKINDLISRAHAYMQSEAERPMHCEMGSFANAQHYKKVPNKSDKMIPLNPGKSGTLLRPPPVELPQSLWELVSKYETHMDMIAGSSAVMRGNLQDGSQLSAEAVQNLQQYASSRVALNAKHIAGSIIEATRQVFWLCRRVYNEAITVQVTLPDGSTKSIDWNSDRQVFESGDEDQIAEITSLENYLTEIKAGTGTPNGQQSRQSTADKLLDRKAIDRIAYLQAYEYPDRDQINQRMEAKEAEDLQNEAFGRATGLNVTKIERNAQPGRKIKE